MSAENTELKQKRWIGIRHRVKMTADGKPSPTEAYILDGDGGGKFEISDEQAELDFVFGIMPTRWHEAAPGEDLSQFKPHHVKTRGKKGEEKKQVPTSYEGLRTGDVIGMILGGSGDYLAFGAAIRAEKIGASVLRIPPIKLKRKRLAEKQDDSENDASLLANLVKNEPSLFFPVYIKDKDQILCRILYRVRRDAMKDRIRCEQCLYQRTIGEVFCAPDGLYPHRVRLSKSTRTARPTAPSWGRMRRRRETPSSVWKKTALPGSLCTLKSSRKLRASAHW